MPSPFFEKSICFGRFWYDASGPLKPRVSKQMYHTIRGAAQTGLVPQLD